MKDNHENESLILAGDNAISSSLHQPFPTFTVTSCAARMSLRQQMIRMETEGEGENTETERESRVERIWSIGRWIQTYPDPDTEDITDW